MVVSNVVTADDSRIASCCVSQIIFVRTIVIRTKIVGPFYETKKNQCGFDLD